MKSALMLIMVLLTPSIGAAATIKVTDLMVREMLPGVKSTAGYFKLTNHSEQPITLQSVSGALSPRIEIHEHVMTQGMMKMQKVTGDIVIAPHQELRFTPGGLHLMIFDPTQKVKKGMNVELAFKFKKGDPVSVVGKVISVLEQQQQTKQHSHHH